MVAWKANDTFTIGDTEYVCRPVTGRFTSRPDRFCLLKARWQVEWYERLLHELAPRTMIEVGIYDGASIALCAELAHPDVLIGIDNRATRSVALDAFLTRRGLDGYVHAYYGVDQADRGRLEAILDRDLAAPLDLVVDDASHVFAPTRAAFNCLYPRLRPGGTYVIEDWPMHQVREIEPPLTFLVVELLLACAAAPKVVANVTVNKNYAVVTRGEMALDPAPFDLAHCYGPRAAILMDRLKAN